MPEAANVAESNRAALAEYALRLGDDSLILAQQLCAWCGHAPAIEVDLSLTNLALDLIGQARRFLSYGAQLRRLNEDADALAFGRDVLDFRNCLLVEQPDGDFAQTIARQFLFSSWQQLFLDVLAQSRDATLAGIAKKAIEEVSYHARFASEWIVRLGDGTAESHARMTAGLDWMWRFVDELFETDPIESALAEQGLGVDCAGLRPAWDTAIRKTLAEGTLPMPAVRRSVTGGRQGRHTEHLGRLLADMQFLQRAYPGANW